MTTFTATVQWLRWTKRDYKRESRTIRGITADSITAAKAIALQPYEAFTNAVVSSIFYDWPQPNLEQ